jgi:hypothetical protein
MTEPFEPFARRYATADVPLFENAASGIDPPSFENQPGDKAVLYY